MAERKWRVRLGAAAEVDFANILKWTAENFGARQSRIYRDTLLRAIGELAGGSDAPGSKARNEIMSGLRTLHVARGGRRGSHFLMYRAVPDSTIGIVRILHDRMELQRHVPPALDESTDRASDSMAAKAGADRRSQRTLAQVARTSRFEPR